MLFAKNLQEDPQKARYSRCIRKKIPFYRLTAGDFVAIIVKLYDSLAQLAEHLTFNQGVRGSNPRWFTNKAEESTTILFSALFYLIVFLTISDCY